MTNLVKDASLNLEQKDRKIEALEKESTNIKNINNNLIIKATKAHNNELLIREL